MSTANQETIRRKVGVSRAGKLCLLAFCLASGGAQAAGEPKSMDDLFLDAKPGAAKEAASLDELFLKPGAAEAEKEAASLDDLFLDREKAPSGDEVAQPGAPGAPKASARSPMAGKDAAGQTRIAGFFQNRLAYTYAKPRHWSKFENTLDVSATGRGGGVAWKLGGQVNYDPIYDLTDFYPSRVRDDQRLQADIREAYLDFTLRDWEFRLGRQHIIWGEMVGLFFADVVSAKDLREAGLREFDMIRIPQWAARAEYFKGDFHGELVWIPHMSYNDIGKPGAEFYPFFTPPGITANILSAHQPRGLDDSAYGVRLSYLKDGWDTALFHYRSNDAAPAFERVAVAPPVVTFRPVHKRIQQWGVTTSKDLRSVVLKAEAVYTTDKRMYTSDPADADGLVAQNVLNYIVGLEWSFPQDTRFNVQFYQQRIPGRKSDLLMERVESGLSLSHVSKALHPRLETDARLFSSLDHRDWLAQFKMNWRMDGNWRATFGVDVFSGDFLFGQFGDRDRVYTEVRYTF